MFDLSKNNRTHKLKYINIAIDYHNTGVSLIKVGKIYNLSRERVRQIHHWCVKHVLMQLGLYEERYKYKECHCEKVHEFLKSYRKFLIENGIKK